MILPFGTPPQPRRYSSTVGIPVDKEGNLFVDFLPNFCTSAVPYWLLSDVVTDFASFSLSSGVSGLDRSSLITFATSNACPRIGVGLPLLIIIQFLLYLLFFQQMINR